MAFFQYFKNKQKNQKGHGFVCSKLKFSRKKNQKKKCKARQIKTMTVHCVAPKSMKNRKFDPFDGYRGKSLHVCLPRAPELQTILPQKRKVSNMKKKESKPLTNNSTPVNSCSITKSRAGPVCVVFAEWERCRNDFTCSAFWSFF